MKKQREKLTSDEFVKIWKGEYLKDPTKSHFYKDISDEGIGYSVEFNDFEVVGDVEVLDEQSELADLRLTNVKVDSFKVSNCKVYNINILERSEISTIVLRKSAAVFYLNIMNSVVKRNINFWEEAKCDVTYISDSQIHAISVQDKNTNRGGFTITKSKIGLVYFEKESSICDFTITESKIRSFWIKERTVIDFVKIEKGTICLDFNFSSIFINEFLSISDSKVKKFQLKVNLLPEVNIVDSFIETLDYKSIIPSTFNLKNCQVIDFNMAEMKTGKDSLIQLIDCQINHLTFDTMLNSGSFNISRLKPLKKGEKFIKNDPPSDTDYNLETYISKTATISFLNSDLGKMMISSDLSTFDKFVFVNSRIVDIFIAGTKLPEISTLDADEIITQKKIAYSQIKKIYENRGDSVTPLIYKGYEMEAYRREVNDEVETKRVDEKWQLFFNYFSNRHGTNWLIPLWWVIRLSSIFYVFYCISLFGFDIHGDWGKAYRLVPYYFEFINPVHKSDFLVDLRFSTGNLYGGIPIFIDFISRLIVPLFIYQMVQAFRKYGKR